MGRITDPSEKRDFVGCRKEAEIHNIGDESKERKTYQDNYNFKPFIPTSSVSNLNFASPFPGNQTNTQNNLNNQANNTFCPRRNFPPDQEQLPPLPMPLTKMYQRLLSIGQVVPVPLIPLQPPFPNWYKPDQKCEYHAGAVGHNIDGCLGFKRKILQLIKTRWISFNESPNVRTNPLPNHASGSGGMNAVEVGEKKDAIPKLTNERLYGILKLAGHLKAPTQTQVVEYMDQYCEYHKHMGHHINSCEEFQSEVGDMMTLGLLRVVTTDENNQVGMVTSFNQKEEVCRY